jgi:hypothetical protein
MELLAQRVREELALAERKVQQEAPVQQDLLDSLAIKDKKEAPDQWEHFPEIPDQLDIKDSPVPPVPQGILDPMVIPGPQVVQVSREVLVLRVRLVLRGSQEIQGLQVLREMKDRSDF